MSEAEYSKDDLSAARMEAFFGGMMIAFIPGILASFLIPDLAVWAWAGTWVLAGIAIHQRHLRQASEDRRQQRQWRADDV